MIYPFLCCIFFHFSSVFKQILGNVYLTTKSHVAFKRIGVIPRELTAILVSLFKISFIMVKKVPLQTNLYSLCEHTLTPLSLTVYM